MGVWTFCGKMIRAPNTFLVLLGLFIAALFIVATVEGFRFYYWCNNCLKQEVRQEHIDRIKSKRQKQTNKTNTKTKTKKR
jgi:hypothetical protein